MRDSLLILGPSNLSREAAQELRRLAAEREGRPVQVASLIGHTDGQELPHDVVAIGRDKPDLQKDVKGSFKRYASLEEYRETLKPVRPKAHEQIEFAPDEPAQPVQVEPQPNGAKAEPDKFEGMDRVQLIRYGADHFPRKRQWATLDSEKLKAALRELEAAH